MVMETAAANRLLGDINRAIETGLNVRKVLVNQFPAIFIEWEPPINRWRILGFRPDRGIEVEVQANQLLLFHPRERIELIIGQIEPLIALDPGLEAGRIAERLNGQIRAGLTFRRVIIESLPFFIARYSPVDRQWLPLPSRFIVDDPKVGQEVGIAEIEVVIFASEDIARLVAQLLRAPPPKEVNIPFSVRQALHALQQREDDIEYGGGIDFELLGGRAEVERLLVFLGGVGEVSGSVRRKFTDDIEMEFHTHPARAIANPSLDDLIAFSLAKQQAALIVARDDMLLMSKQPGFVKLGRKADICAIAEQAGLQGLGFAIDSPLISVRLERARALDTFLNQFLKIDTERIPRSEPGPINIPLKIVQVPSR